MYMESNTLSIDGTIIAIGGRKRPIADVVAIVSTASGISIMFRDGTVDLADGCASDFYTIRDRCPWAMAAI